jgi:hypothetical protein
MAKVGNFFKNKIDPMVMNGKSFDLMVGCF